MLSGANQPVDQMVIGRCVSTYERPKRKASAKNLRESAISVRKNKIFSHPCYFSRSIRAPHPPDPAVPFDLTTARELTRAPQPQHDIPQMAGEETSHGSMHSRRRCH